MTKRPIRDMAASVRQRLFDKAKSTKRPFEEVLKYFAMERFLYRLASSPHADKFILKGALMLTVWRAPDTRPTMDIDVLGRLPNNVDAVTKVVRAICGQKVDDDGLVFPDDSVRGKIIKEGVE